MEDFSKKDYVMRISNASPLGLVNITFELIFNNINLALENKDNLTNYIDYVQKAKSFLENLIDSLDADQELSDNLFRVYTTSRGILIKAAVSNYNYKDLTDVVELLKPIADSFKSIDDTEKSVMQKTQKVYAGLTYGKKGLDEYIESGSKGFEG
ncbi:MAG: flagellar protein FliS [Lachnospirales bacterium]